MQGSCSENLPTPTWASNSFHRLSILRAAQVHRLPWPLWLNLHEPLLRGPRAQPVLSKRVGSASSTGSRENSAPVGAVGGRCSGAAEAGQAELSKLRAHSCACQELGKHPRLATGVQATPDPHPTEAL